MFSGGNTNGMKGCFKQAGIWDIVSAESFYVVPPEWPKDAHDAFRLQEVPTPYEVACRFVQDIRTNKRLHPCDICCLWWWLAGTPCSALESLGFRVEEQLQRAVLELGMSETFRMWALGTDLVPSTGGDPDAMRWVTAFMSSQVIEEGGPAAKWATAIAASPWIQGQLLSGQRLLPVTRPLKFPDYFFPSVEAKKVRFPRSLS